MPPDYPPLHNTAYLRSVLERLGVHPRRATGQHFLVCEWVTAATLDVLAGGPKRVTELGAGCGALTWPLLARRFTVRAVERDPRLAGMLRELAPEADRRRFDLVTGDLRRVRWEWDQPWQLAGNIPYNLSGYIIRRLTQLTPPPAQAIFLLQREVGQRITADVPYLQLLALAVRLWGTARLVHDVAAGCFWPAPQVASQLLVLQPHGKPELPAAEREYVLRLAAQFFRSRRKQMGGVLRRARGLTAAAAERYLAHAGIAPQQRPQEIPLPQWMLLSQILPRQ